jgi:hypothetical protein
LIWFLDPQTAAWQLWLNDQNWMGNDGILPGDIISHPIVAIQIGWEYLKIWIYWGQSWPAVDPQGSNPLMDSTSLLPSWYP